MAMRSCCSGPTFLYSCRSCKSCRSEAMEDAEMFGNRKECKSLALRNSSMCSADRILTTGLRRKISTFRDLMDLPPSVWSTSIDEMLTETMEDLHELYPEIIPRGQLEIGTAATEQGLAYFCTALKSIGDLWKTNGEWMDSACYDAMEDIGSNGLEKIVRIVLATLDGLIKIVRKKFDMTDEDDDGKDDKGRETEKSMSKKTDEESLSGSPFGMCLSPVTPTSVLPVPPKNPLMEASYLQPFLGSLRVRTIGKLNPVDVKRLALYSFSNVAVPTNHNANLNGGGDNLNLARAATVDLSLDEKVKEGSVEEDVNAQNLPENSALMQPLAVIRKEAPPVAPTMLPQSPKPNNMNQNLIWPAPPTPPPPPTFASKIKRNTAAKVTLSSSPPSPPPLPMTAATSAPPPPTPPSPIPSGNGMAPNPPLPGAARGPAALLPAPVLLGNKMAPPPPPLHGVARDLTPPPPGRGMAPPPPPPGAAGRSLRPKKPSTKLKRSTHISSLYRLLKGKVEGSSRDGTSANGRKGSVGASNIGNQGMADALAEMTKRSAYFQQIEEDVQKYAKPIIEMKAKITSFQTKDMGEVLKFHEGIESILEHLIDESQVLARFEGFPVKKLETLRIAMALYKKLDAIVVELHNFKIEPPLGQLLDKVERYFNKIKGELDKLERVKDEESKKFATHNIHFNFDILLRVKEAIVDLSSSCMELALRESREAKTMLDDEKGPKIEVQRSRGYARTLWRVFQFAFRVYTFAGGQDDRAEKLTRELAQEIETDPRHQ